MYTDGTLVKWSQNCEDGWSDVSGNLAVECADDIKDKEAMCRPLSEEEKKKKNTSGYIFIGVFTVIGTAIWFGVAHLCKKRKEKTTLIHIHLLRPHPQGAPPHTRRFVAAGDRPP